MRSLRVLAVPCQDGFGPAALMAHVIGEVLRRWPQSSVTIHSNRRVAGGGLYCARLFEGARQVEVVARGNPLWLAKPGGVTSIAETMKHLAEYPEWSRGYSPGGDFDLAIEYGVPAVARWAADAGIPCVSLFDHAWSVTLEAMAREQGFDSPAFRDAIGAIRDDEKRTQEMFLLPAFAAPAPYPDYWRSTAAGNVTQLRDALGGTRLWPRLEARRFLGLRDRVPAVLVQAGDTPAWDPVLPRMVRQFASRDRSLGADILIHVPARLEMPRLERNRYRRLRRVRMPAGPFQSILPAVDLIVGRAGGGTVNDAVACGTPLVCVDEPGQPQVRAILEACVARGIARALPWGVFSRNPAEAVLRAIEGRRGGRTRAAGRGGERAVADRIGELTGLG